MDFTICWTVLVCMIPYNEPMKITVLIVSAGRRIWSQNMLYNSPNEPMNWDLLMFLLVAHNGVIHNVDRPLTTMESTIITNWVRQIKERSPKHGLESLTLWKQGHKLQHIWFIILCTSSCMVDDHLTGHRHCCLANQLLTLLLLHGSINYSIHIVRTMQI